LTTRTASHRLDRLRKIAAVVVALLFLKVLLAILWEYRWYFPANFESSAFLHGRERIFAGAYRGAFYTHILSGPVAIGLAVFMMLTGGRQRFAVSHRRMGRVLMVIVFVLVAPSGLVMAGHAFAGPWAGLGFASLAIATAASAAFALFHARAGNFQLHRRWATRCFLLLASPLLLRLFAGAAIVTHLESNTFYRLNAWLSWLIPLAIYELWELRRASLRQRTRV